MQHVIPFQPITPAFFSLSHQCRKVTLKEDIYHYLQRNIHLHSEIQIFTCHCKGMTLLWYNFRYRNMLSRREKVFCGVCLVHWGPALRPIRSLLQLIDLYFFIFYVLKVTYLWNILLNSWRVHDKTLSFLQDVISISNYSSKKETSVVVHYHFLLISL